MFYIPITDFWTDNKIEAKEAAGIAETPCLCAHSENDLMGKVENAHALLAGHTISITGKTIQNLKQCTAIIRYGVGYDNIDIAGAKAHGITVCNVPDYGTNEVADHAFSLILTLTRNIVHHTASLSETPEIWNTFDGGELKRLSVSTLGIIGLGRIGTAMALRAKAFGMQVVFYDPYVDSGKEKSLFIQRAETLKELASVSDIITIHAPLTPETAGMISHDFFSWCRPGIILINTARGKIVDTDALHEAMKKSVIQRAGLDVLEKEPLDYEHPLFKAWIHHKPWIFGRLALTPHSASYTKESFEELRRKAVQEAIRACRREPLKNPVNLTLSLKL